MNRWTSTISFCLLIWLVPFFGIIAPGHQRGVIKTPGSEGSSAQQTVIATPKCALCAFVAAFADREQTDVPPSPTGPAGDCAICHFNGTLLNPPVFELPNLRPVRIDLLVMDVPEAHHLIAVALDQVIPRGPPV
ncbi:MAG: hypothetical protein AAF916_05645 [Planctomycetota bacterium]